MHENDLHASQEDLLDLNEIMRLFGVNEWTNLGVQENPRGEELQVLVEIQGKRYLLKEYPATLGEQRERSHSYVFQRYLTSQGIPVAPFWQISRQEAFVTLGDDSFVLQEWSKGTVLTSSDARERTWIASAGEMLGRLHQASLHYPGSQYRWPSEVHAGGLVQGWLNFARGRAEQCEVYAIATALSNMVEAWEATLPASMMAIGTGRALPEFHIHGDYSALNLHFRGHEVSEVLGLEASRWEKRLLEVAYGVFSFAGLNWSGEDGLTRPLVRRGLDPERANLFLRNYAAVYPSVPGEAALLVDALALVAPIIVANGPLEDVFYASEHLEDVPVEDTLERLAWATALPSWLMRVRRSFAEMW